MLIMPSNNKITAKSGPSQVESGSLMGGGVYPGTALWDDPKFKETHPVSRTSISSPPDF